LASGHWEGGGIHAVGDLKVLAVRHHKGAPAVRRADARAGAFTLK